MFQKSKVSAAISELRLINLTINASTIVASNISANRSILLIDFIAWFYCSTDNSFIVVVIFACHDLIIRVMPLKDLQLRTIGADIL